MRHAPTPLGGHTVGNPGRAEHRAQTPGPRTHPPQGIRRVRHSAQALLLAMPTA